MGTFESASDQVVLAALADDPEALAELFRRYRRPVIMYAARRCDRPADVDDVVAETFLAALTSADRYDPAKGEVRPWLLGITRNQLGLLRRRESRQRGIELAVRQQPELSDDAVARLVERMAAAEEDAVIKRALAQLSDDQREALLLVSREELSLKEAATVLGVSAPAFRVRLFRARRAMQALLPPEPPEHQPTLSLPEEAKKS